VTNYIRLKSGQRFDYDDETSTDKIMMLDIATHLSRIPRFLGATRDFYSVAQHSVLVSILLQDYGPQTAAYGLLHDAHEAFMGDIPTPLKSHIFEVSGFDVNDIAEKIDQRIFERFRLPYPMPEKVAALVKQADMTVFVREAQQLVKNFRPTSEHLIACGEFGKRALTINPAPSDRAQVDFMSRWAHLERMRPAGAR
jgi:uncharacterized protein